LLLLGHKDDAEAALADLLQEFVRTNDGAGSFGEPIAGCRRNEGACGKKVVGLCVSLQEPLDTPPQVGVVAADPVKVGGTLCGQRQLQSVTEDVIQLGFGSVHDFTSTMLA
jgi:hypothetical protein